MRILTEMLYYYMYLWIIKRPNILAYLGNISVALYVEESVQNVELSVKEISYQLLSVSQIVTVI